MEYTEHVMFQGSQIAMAIRAEKKFGEASTNIDANSVFRLAGAAVVSPLTLTAQSSVQPRLQALLPPLAG